MTGWYELNAGLAFMPRWGLPQRRRWEYRKYTEGASYEVLKTVVCLREELPSLSGSSSDPCGPSFTLVEQVEAAKAAEALRLDAEIAAEALRLGTERGGRPQVIADITRRLREERGPIPPEVVAAANAAKADLPGDPDPSDQIDIDLHVYVAAHLSAMGACEDADPDGDESLCASPECTYCQMARALQPNECGPPLGVETRDPDSLRESEGAV